MRGGWVYILTNRPNGTLYLGVTNDIARRAWEHREGLAEGFTRPYGVHTLVWYEGHGTMESAIAREKAITGEGNQRMETGLEDRVNREK